MEDVQYVIMSDDGTGSGIRIPSMLIGKSDGQNLIDFLMKYGGTPSVKNQKANDEEEQKSKGDNDTEADDVVDKKKDKPKKPRDQEKETQSSDPKSQKMLEMAQIIITFNMENPDNRVEYDIWFTSTDDRALDFINNFREYDKLLAENVLMTPHYVTFDCTDCDKSFIKKECYGNGKFCAINHKSVKLSGQEIILEDIRESCVYNNSMENYGNAELFWKYMERAHAMCSDYINEDCSRSTHKDLGLSWDETNSCVDDTFGGDKSK